MKAIEGVYKQRALLTAGAAFVLFALGGCGGGGGGGGVVGGGGGGGGAGGPPGFSYAPSLGAATLDQIDGFSAAFSVTGNTLTSTAPSVLSGAVIVTPNTPTSGDYRFTVSGIQHGGGGTEPTFSFTVIAANLAANGTIAGACSGCLRTGTVIADDGQTVTITDANLAALGLNYSTMGLWSKPSDLAAAPNTDIGSAFVFGVETRGVDLPTTGQATYTGPMIGKYAGNPGTGAAVFTVGATATATANFTARSVGFSTAGSVRTADIGGLSTLDPNLNLTGTLTYAAGVNSLTSTSLSAGYGMTGQARATFFGPPATTAPFAPPELGGAVALSNPGGSQSMVGSFALKRQ